MVALVAMLLVATGGSARVAHARTSAGTGHASAMPHSGRPVAALPATSPDHAPLHLDLASTPPADALAKVLVVIDEGPGDDESCLPGDLATAVGRGPPAL
jgi:hypothetical protein